MSVPRATSALSFPRLLAGVLLALALASPAVWSQQGAPGAAPVTEEGELTVEGLEARIAEVEARSDLERARKDEVVKVYRAAIDFLKKAADEAAQMAKLEADRVSAPERLAAIKAELARPIPEPEPEVEPSAPARDLHPHLLAARAELEVAEKARKDLEAETERRGERRKTLPSQLADERTRLEAVKAELASPPVPETPAELLPAQRAEKRARRLVLERSITRYEAEIKSYDARDELLTARLDLAKRSLQEADKLAKAWQGIVAATEKREAADAEKSAAAALRDVENVEVLKNLAENVAELTRERTRIIAQAKATSQEVDGLEGKLKELESTYKNTEERVKAAGLTDAIGLILREKRANLPSVRDLRKRSRDRAEKAAELEIRRINLTAERESLATLDGEVAAVLAGIKIWPEGWTAPELEAKVRDFLVEKKTQVDEVLRVLRQAIDLLGTVEEKDARILEKTEQYAQFIDERVLWIRSAQPLWKISFSAYFDGVQWVLKEWKPALDAWSRGPWASRVWLALLGLCMIALAATAPAMGRKIRDLGNVAMKGSCVSFTPTLKAFLLTVLRGSIPGLLVLDLGWQIATTADSDRASALAAAVLAGGGVLLGVGILRQICVPGGLALSHFRWRPGPVGVLRRTLSWAGLLLVVGRMAVEFLELLRGFSPTDFAGQLRISVADSVGRLSFLGLMAVLIAMVWFVLSPRIGFLSPGPGRSEGGWAQKRRQLLFVFALAIPVSLGLLSIFGYTYTARMLLRSVRSSAGLIMGMLLIQSLVLRALVVAKRRLLRKQVKERLEAKQAAGEARSADESGSELPPVEVAALDADTVDSQSRQFLRSLMGFGMAVGLWLLWSSVLPALQGFNEVKIPGTAVSLSNALFGLLVLIMTLLAARNLPGLLEFTVLQKLPFDAGERYAITTISRYTITLVGVLWVLRVAGIEWSSLQWTAAGLSLGIGFGLQEIVANFISGLIILFEQPVRVGDIVTVAGIDGRVTRIRMRATTIADWDRRELVVPNKEFVTGSIVNWTLSDPVTRLVIPVGIAYGSDTALARTILLRVARENSFVQVEPTPSAIFRGFGDSTLNFELRIFIPTRDVWPQVVDDLHTRIDLEFRKSGIEIAFPQRDLHIRSAEPLARAMLEARREREKQESGEPWRTKGGGDAPK